MSKTFEEKVDMTFAVGDWNAVVYDGWIAVDTAVNGKNDCLRIYHENGIPEDWPEEVREHCTQVIQENREMQPDETRNRATGRIGRMSVHGDTLWVNWGKPGFSSKFERKLVEKQATDPERDDRPERLAFLNAHSKPPEKKDPYEELLQVIKEWHSELAAAEAPAVGEWRPASEWSNRDKLKVHVGINKEAGIYRLNNVPSKLNQYTHFMAIDLPKEGK